MKIKTEKQLINRIQKVVDCYMSRERQDLIEWETDRKEGYWNHSRGHLGNQTIEISINLRTGEAEHVMVGNAN